MKSGFAGKKLLLSLATVAVVVTGGVFATRAYFTDTEKSTGNTFTAGTIDISVNNYNPWEGKESFTMEDMKPCYTDYINFEIQNVGDNPADVWKNLKVTLQETGEVSEPECEAEGGTWDGACSGNTERNNLVDVIWYDLKVEVYDSTGKIWWQTIYVDADHQSINDVYGGGEKVYLGMIPVGAYMKVEQSYHMKPTAGNEYQGDIMTFDITLEAKQIMGTVVLENKTGADPWKIIHDGIQGTLTYDNVKHPTFDFSFTGVAPEANNSYDLVAITDIPNDKGVLLGTDISDASGNIDIAEDVNVGDLKDAKVWLITTGHLDVSTGTWHNYQNDQYLWETGLIWYEDTGL